MRARRPFFVVKFHANLFNGSLAIANKRGDELFVERGVYVHACVCMSRRDRTFVARARLSLSLSLSRSRHAELVSYSSEKYKINIVSDPCVDIFLSLFLSLSVSVSVSVSVSLDILLPR